MLNKDDLKAKFALQTKTLHVKCVDDEVRIRKLTISQRAKVDEIMFADTQVQGEEIKVEINRYRKASKLAVCFALIEPELSLRDIDELGEDSVRFVDEVYSALVEFDVPKKSQGESNILK